MNQKLDIRSIKAKETHGVRHPILRAGRPLSSCVFDGDESASTLHIGAFYGDKLVGVLSAYEKKHISLKQKNSYQVRGVAVLEDFQNHGIGKKLMAHIEHTIPHNSMIWLNARERAANFYRQLNYKQYGDMFMIEPIGWHYCMYKTISHAS